MFDACGAGNHEKDEDDSTEYSNQTDAPPCVLNTPNEPRVSNPLSSIPHWDEMLPFLLSFPHELVHLLLGVDVVESVHVERPAHTILVEVPGEPWVGADGGGLD